jgi:hypothetical protein
MAEKILRKALVWMGVIMGRQSVQQDVVDWGLSRGHHVHELLWLLLYAEAAIYITQGSKVSDPG